MVYTKQGKKVIEWSSWLHQSLKVLKPPENLTVSEWADKYRVLDSKTSNEPGKWRTDRTPYLRGIMDSFNDPEVEEGVFVKPTQVGGTEELINIIGFIISQDQAPTLVVYPTEALAEYTSTNRLKPMISLCEPARDAFLNDQSKILELQFTGMYLCLSGANSPSSLASKPIQNLIIDEPDKFPTNAGKEADPVSLARERTKTFAGTRKILQACTPTFEYGPIWQAHLACDRWMLYYVPCPHCGVYNDLKFSQLKWDKDAKTNDEIADSTYYECESCQGVINDYHKPQMLKSGEWEAREKNQGKKKTSFRLNVLYSPWVRFGEVAVKWKEAQSNPTLLQNFINSWLGEPWKDIESQIKANIVFDRQTELKETIVPKDTVFITAGVDVQKKTFPYVIRAWSPFVTSQCITYGNCESWEELEYIMNLPYQDQVGRLRQVQLCALDTGYRAEDVYDFCALNMDWAYPVKGSSRALPKRFNISSIDKPHSKAHGMSLYIVDTAQYKDMIMGRLKRPNGRGSFMVFNGIDEDYCKQLTSEEKIKIKQGSGYVYQWQLRPGVRHNHYLDCEVYNSFAADLLGIRYCTDVAPTHAPKGRQEKEEKTNSYIQQDSNNWLNTKGSWL